MVLDLTNGLKQRRLERINPIIGVRSFELVSFPAGSVVDDKLSLVVYLGRRNSGSLRPDYVNTLKSSREPSVERGGKLGRDRNFQASPNRCGVYEEFRG